MDYPGDSINCTNVFKYAPDKENARIGFPVVALGLLITSYYYCLPLGRFSFAGLQTDIRIYDIAFVVFMLLVGLKNWPGLRALRKDRQSFHYWAMILTVFVWLSLIMTLIMGGMNSLFPAIIRTIRFSAYLITAGFVTSLVDTPLRQRFILGLIYLNIAVQAGLAFAQGLGILPHLWPTYWTISYGKIPVGTLSPHHKHIGVVMMLGIAMSFTYLRHPLGLFNRPLVVALLGCMLAVSVFAISRTAWLGIALFLLAYLFIKRIGGLPILILAGAGILLLFMLTRDTIQNPLVSKIDAVFVERIEQYGYQGVLKARLNIYKNYPQTLRNAPWILLFGTGFQNINSALGIAAHNNYVQALFELGIIGFVIYVRLLLSVLKSLQRSSEEARTAFERTFAMDMWAAFVGVMVTMLVGETLWAQYSMFTLTGQIMTLMALAASSFYWANSVKPENNRETRIPNYWG